MIIPDTSTLYKNVLRDSDNRGEILSIADAELSNVSIITCNADSIRSNHYHKKDYHFMYVLYGEINYFYKSLVSKEVYYIKVCQGDTIFTPCLEIHATHFPIESKLIVSSKHPRDQKTYENDTIRVSFVNRKNLKEIKNISKS